MQPMTNADARMRASLMGQSEGWPRKYYWTAVWLRLSAKESANPDEWIRHSRNQIDLYRDCLKRPRHYTRRRSMYLTDYQKMKLEH